LVLTRQWRANRVFIEEAGVGYGHIPELCRENISCMGVRSETRKEARADLVTAKFEAGQVYFPRQAEWLLDLETELLAFPGGRHDDQVDSIVQALTSARRRMIILGLKD
jgi:predicted phage terminase large subunit-like protein